MIGLAAWGELRQTFDDADSHLQDADVGVKCTVLRGVSVASLALPAVSGGANYSTPNVVPERDMPAPEHCKPDGRAVESVLVSLSVGEPDMHRQVEPVHGEPESATIGRPEARTRFYSCSRHKPTKSTTSAANSESRENLNVSTTPGLNSARHIPDIGSVPDLQVVDRTHFLSWARSESATNNETHARLVEPTTPPNYVRRAALASGFHAGR